MMEQNMNDLQQKNWYVVKTYSNHEARVVESIIQRAKSYNLEDKIFRVICATESVEPIEIDEAEQVAEGEKPKKKKKPKLVNLYPGFIFVEMIMSDDAWYVVRNTPGVMGIEGSAGGGTKPVPVPADEMESVLKRIGQADEATLAQYEPGQKVTIINGFMANSIGKVVAVEDKMVKVSINFMGKDQVFEFELKDIDAAN